MMRYRFVSGLLWVTAFWVAAACDVPEDELTESSSQNEEGAQLPINGTGPGADIGFPALPEHFADFDDPTGDPLERSGQRGGVPGSAPGENSGGVPGENSGGVPGDEAPVCGDGLCEGAESPTCAVDCSTGSTCGDGVCAPEETSNDCPGDCQAMAVCGDGTCEASEEGNCQVDCDDDGIEVCGDGYCEGSESGTNCPMDCASGTGSGNDRGAGESGGGSAANFVNKWECVEALCSVPYQVCMNDVWCSALHQCMEGCGSDDSCQDYCLYNADIEELEKLVSMAQCAANQGCNDLPDTGAPGSGSGGSGGGVGGGLWDCVADLCAPEWTTCQANSGCWNLHTCLLDCGGAVGCEEQCLAVAPPGAAEQIESMASCAASMGCF